MHYKYLLNFMLFLILGAFLFSSHVCSAQEKKKYGIAVLNLQANGVSETEAKGISEKIRSRISFIVKSDPYIRISRMDQYDVVEETQQEKIYEQFNRQNTGCVNDSCLVEFGKQLGVDRIIIGSVNLLGKTYSISTRMIDVELGKTIQNAEKDYKGQIDDLVNSSIMKDLADELLLGCKFDDWQNSERISVEGNPGNASVYADGIILGKTPILNKMILLDTRNLRIEKSGYEPYSEKLSLEKGKPIKIEYNLNPKSRMHAVMNSIILPGSGQFYTEHTSRGNFFMTCQTLTLIGAATTYFLSKNAYDTYDKSIIAYNGAVKHEDIEQTRKTMKSKYDDASLAHTLHVACIGATAGVYVWNVLDALFFGTGAANKKVQKASLDVTPGNGENSTILLASVRF